MTFGYGSPGFDPVWCPPCPEGHICNTMCIDAVDGPILILSMVAAVLLIGLVARRNTENE